MSVRPQVTVEPGKNFGRPSIGGGPSCEVVADHVWGGEGVAEIADDYSLTRAQVLVGCWFVGTYGITDHTPGRIWGRQWRERWWAWAAEHETGMWHGNWDDIPDPPSKEDQR